MKTIEIQQDSVLEAKIISWLRKQPHACMLNGNDYTYPQGPFRKYMAAGHKTLDASAGWQETLRSKTPGSLWFGYIGYELQGKAYGDERAVFLGFPAMSLFEADAVFEWKEKKLIISAAEPEALLSEISVLPAYEASPLPAFPAFRSFISRDEYLRGVSEIQQLIREGEVYELNYCQYFESSIAPDGLDFYLHINRRFPMPFSGWYRSGELEIASASPERFLRREGRELLSQPIKGTARRGSSEEEDRANRDALFRSEKERAENMMIVDLVRNDLAKVSLTGSTTVEEMFGIYAFPTVFQMISTVRSVLRKENDNATALESAFPMGSMTGAPKQEVISRITGLEPLRRGAYSGSLGCFGPGEDFDLNVLIRSLFINHKLHRCGFAVGSAITIDSVAEEEWEECEAKAASIRSIAAC